MALEGMIPDSTIPPARFLYNNKEFEAAGGVYFYGARLYVPVIGRFAGVDPISEQFAHVSVFNYAENEPVGHIDLWGLQKISIYYVGQLLKNQNSFATVGTATLDIGNNNSFSYSFTLDGLGSFSGTYSKENGYQRTSEVTVDFSKIGFEADRPRGIVLPTWAIKMGLNKVKDAYTPDNLEEAHSLSKEEKQFNQTMRFILNTIKGLAGKDVFTALYDYDGSEGTATNEDGEPYGRKFTHVYKAYLDNLTVSIDGVKLEGKVVISYTEQKCTSNCNEDKNE